MSQSRPYSIEKINDNEHFSYKGDVHVAGNIGKNATVIITEGNLIVDGSIESDAQLDLVCEQKSLVISSGIYFSNASFGSINGINTGKSLNVAGNVDNNVTISSVSADVIITGSVGDRCKFNTQSGSIIARNIGNQSHLTTMSGDVNVGNVSAHCVLKTMSGAIHAANIDTDCVLSTMSGDVKASLVNANSSLKTMSGNVRVQSADQSVTLETMSGTIYENGMKRKKANAYKQNNSISIGGMSFIGSGRVIVNGRDITDIVNNATHISNESAEQEPIRYIKKS